LIGHCYFKKIAVHVVPRVYPMKPLTCRPDGPLILQQFIYQFWFIGDGGEDEGAVTGLQHPVRCSKVSLRF